MSDATPSDLEKSAAPAEPMKKRQSVVFRIARPLDDPMGPALPPREAVVTNSFEPEDSFKNYYLGGNNNIGALIPPYDLQILDRLSQENNALSPCIEAMVTNIDGTGHEIVKPQAVNSSATNEEVDSVIEELNDFFNEPSPGEDFISIRTQIRRDTERTGNGYMEILRTVDDRVAFIKHVDSKMMRILKLSVPFAEKKSVKRGGKQVELTVMTRYRRFVQMLNGKQLRYFKEFGCPLNLNKDTGLFEGYDADGKDITGMPDYKPMALNLRASEIIHFMALPDTNSPYGVPRWVAQIPSVIGSRKAEEYNLEFFESGGVPPVVFMLQGGVLSPESRQALEQRMGGAALKKNKVVVIEVEPVGGSMDSPNNAKVTVEKFGSSMTKDAQFEGYDRLCEERVRRSFRLPPIFVGQTSAHSFASAYTSYAVAEAQVFKPERNAFDAIISVKLIPEILGGTKKGYRLKSKPIAIEDATLKLQGLQIAQASQQIDAEDLVDEVNSAVGTNLEASKTLPPPQLAGQDASLNPKDGVPGGKPKRNDNGSAASQNKSKRPASTPVKSPAVQKADVVDALAEGIAQLSDLELDKLHDYMDRVHPDIAEKMQAAE